MLLLLTFQLEAMDVHPAISPSAGGLGTLFTGTGSDPAYPPYRDPAYWPTGYFSGDPLPPSTIYLSFDDGPTDFTMQILDILKEEGVRATFFINSYDKNGVGKSDTSKNMLFRYKDSLQKMVRDGNVIGNHSYSHRDFAQLSRKGIDFQLSTLQRQLTEVLGDETPPLRLIRPPFGSPWIGSWNSEEQRQNVKDALAGRGFVMLWTTGWDSSDSADWADGEWFDSLAKNYHPGGPSYEAKMQREMGRILKWADGLASGVILMHDTHPTSRDILKSAIEELKRRGYSFATLEDYCRWRWGSGVFGLGR
jgi:peptidoglycan/xylan/chitin deacetylase (PgdA/CDA1 family)